MTRYSSRPLPHRAFLPGRSPRADRPPPPPPSSSPPPSPTGDTALAAHDDFRHGVDLFNHGFAWEAHEQWEPLWRARPRASAERALLHGLIQAAAAVVKARTGKPAVARRFVARAADALARADTSIVDARALRAALVAWVADPARPPPTIVLAS